MIQTEMDRAKTLVVGANGQVGAQMLRHLSQTDGRDTLLPSSRVERAGWLRLDLAELVSREQVATLLDGYRIGRIFCIAGMTNVDACESSGDMAHWVNARGPGALAAYAEQRGIGFVYFSTEYLFDGSGERPGPYLEDAPPHPLNVYGASKLAGEKAVLEACDGALVLRTTVVYGPDAGEKNYLYSVMRNLVNGRSMRVPEDQVSTPTYNRDLILAAVGLVEAGASGVFHVCGPELLGRLAFAREIAVTLGLDAGLLHGVATAELGQPARRPLAAGLASSKLATLYPHLRMRTLAEALEDCSGELRAFVASAETVSQEDGVR